MKHHALILQNAAGEGPGILGDVLRDKGWHIHLIRLHRNEAIQSEWQDYELLVIMGGPMNVYEEKRYPYLAHETTIIRQALQTHMPTLGFCLGAQLMAKAAGAKVRHGSQKEIGWYQMHLTAEGAVDPLLRFFPPEFTVFQWHGDTFDLPEGGVRMASSKNYPNQAIRLGSLSYGFQFHVEVTQEMIAEWLSAYEKEVRELKDHELAARILRETPVRLPEIHNLARSFFNHYLNRVARS